MIRTPLIAAALLLPALPTLAQAEVPIVAGDSESTLEARVLEAEHRLYPKALAEFVKR